MNLFKRKPKVFFTEEEETNIVNAIKQAEKNTSGEIKVHVESKCDDDAFSRGVEVFTELQLQETAQRNGVLFYIAIDAHKFAIVADEGINQVVPDGFWDEIKQVMRDKFQTGNIVNGLQSGILMAGEELKSHFPYQADDENELSDEISKGD